MFFGSEACLTRSEEFEMSARIRWINHKGVKILVNDYNGLQGKNLLKQIDLCVLFIKQTKKNDILLLIDILNVEVSKESQIKFAGAAKQVKEHCKKVAIIGLTPVKRTIINTINKITGLGGICMKNDIMAKNWLTTNQ